MHGVEQRLRRTVDFYAACDEQRAVGTRRRKEGIEKLRRRTVCYRRGIAHGFALAYRRFVGAQLCGYGIAQNFRADGVAFRESRKSFTVGHYGVKSYFQLVRYQHN